MKTSKVEQEDNKNQNENIGNKKEKIHNIAKRGIIKLVALIAVISMLAATCGSLIYYLINM